MMLHQEPDQHYEQDQQHIHFDSTGSLGTWAYGLGYRKCGAHIAGEAY